MSKVPGRPADTDPRHDHGIVLLPGIQDIVGLIAQPLLRVCSRHGRLLPIEYGSEAFDLEKTIDLVDKKTRNYLIVTLIGSSVGAMVAHLVRLKLLERRPGLEVRLIFIDPLADASDVKNPLIGLAPFIPDWDKWNAFSRLFWIFGFTQPKMEQLNPDPDFLPALRDHWRLQRHYPLRTWLSLATFIVMTPGPQPGSAAGSKLIILRSTRDKFVKPGASSKWCQAARLLPDEVIREVDSDHGDLLGYSCVWPEVIDAALCAQAET